jgi:hypothetical protein
LAILAAEHTGQNHWLSQVRSRSGTGARDDAGVPDQLAVALVLSSISRRAIVEIPQAKQSFFLAGQIVQQIAVDLLAGPGDAPKAHLIQLALKEKAAPAGGG